MGDWATVAAGFGGTALGIGGTWWVERWRLARSEASRWLTERRELYARFLEATEEVVSITGRMAINAAIPGEVGRDWHQDSDALHRADRRVRHLNAEIELIGGDDEVRAANVLRDAAWAVHSSKPPHGHEGDGPNDRATAFKAWIDATEEFTQAARHSLLAGNGSRPARARPAALERDS
jgi:hypothetical protein